MTNTSSQFTNMSLWFPLAVLAGMNIWAFGAMLWDKRSARLGQWRISEASLIALSLFGGSLGALTGALFARHKTRKQPIATILLAMPFVHLSALIVWWADWLPISI